MPSPKHDLLTSLGAKWLKQQGFPIIATEFNAAGSREQADVVGFRSACSAIIEVKVSRADFFADKSKLERQNDGKRIMEHSKRKTKNRGKARQVATLPQPRR